jgi:hypothetical protein
MTSLQKRLKRKDRVGTAKDQTNVIQKKNIRDKEDNLVVAFPNKDMFKNVF